MSASEVLDVLLVAAFIWLLLAWLRRSRARFVLVGVSAGAVVFLAAHRLQLQLTVWLLQGLAAALLIFVVLVFQDDLRRIFEQIGRLGARRSAVLPPSTAEQVARAVTRMAAARIGALLVVPGREPLDRFLEGGNALDAWISEAMLLSLFDTRSPGHDGAVVLAGNRAARFAVHLPLSTDRAQLGPTGTRHAAALGLAERSDALCIVVSEERGTISVAREGRLRPVADAEALAAELRPFLERSPATPADRWRAVRARLPEAALALVLALGLWFLAVPGARVVEVERSVAVQIENLPEGYALESVEPAEVDVTLSGERRRLVIGDAVEVRVDALLAQLGRRTFELSEADVVHPSGTQVVDVSPGKVRIRVQQGEEAP